MYAGEQAREAQSQACHGLLIGHRVGVSVTRVTPGKESLGVSDLSAAGSFSGGWASAVIDARSPGS